ncbi:ankyrin repeat domain-containing protein [Rubrivirga sp. IMCC45206]|uniref:ankyrin repeat domain-containing protein n=1 Tax=Rubrivirga sp. IMCC45206 TaxID=3391614 RepID=UPI00398F9B25
MTLSTCVWVIIGLAATAAATPSAAAQSCERASRLAFVASSPASDLSELVALLDAGVGIDCYSTGKTALMHAARWKSHAALAHLLERGADASLRSTDDGWTALQYAVSERDAEASRLLAGHLGVPDPLAPADPPRPVPPPAPTPAPTLPRTTGGTRWAPFGTYRVGDRVQVWTAAGWRSGTVTDVGNATNDGTLASRAYERKYRVADDRFGGDGDWSDWGLVAGLDREPWWTSHFVGVWALGETMAVNTYAEGRTETTEVSYGAATETLRVGADGTYVWRGHERRPSRGRWVPAEGVPGVVLKAGPGGRDWTLFNQSNATEENLRRVETARLFADGQMSVAAKRSLGP